MDECDEKLGVRTPQTVATARVLSLSSVALHRTWHVTGARQDLENNYFTLAHYQDAAKHRLSYFQTLEKIGERFWLALVSMASSSPTQYASIGPPPDTPARIQRRRGLPPFLKKKWIGRIWEHITPGKGRAKNPKNPSRKDLAHRCRADECDGLTLCTLVKTDPDGKLMKKSNGQLEQIRRACVICGTKTNMVCTGCQRFFCIDKDRGKVLEAEEDSPSLMRMERFFLDEDDEVKKDYKYAIRSCYHIGHEKRLDAYWDEMRTKDPPLARLCAQTNLLSRLDEVEEERNQE